MNPSNQPEPKPHDMPELGLCIPDAQAEVGLRDRIAELITDELMDDDVDYWPDTKPWADKIIALVQSHMDATVRKAEELMGEAVIARHRQANYQWEKTESFIQSYQEQKRSNPYSLSCLQPPTAGEGESV